MRKITGLVLISILFLLSIVPVVLAQESNRSEKVNLYFFWAEGCPHCSDEKIFLDKLVNEYENLEIHMLEVTNNPKNAELLANVGKELKVDISGVPFTVVGKQYFIGWYNEETTGSSIEDAIHCVLEDSCLDVVGSLITPVTPSHTTEGKDIVPEKISLPILGEVETKNISLPFLSVFMGVLDGFNPCAMWVLLFLISILLGMKDKKRMWILGITFIVVSAAVYFLFMAAWLNLILFLGFIFWVRIMIALVALGGGCYNLREYFINKDSGCKVVGEKKRQKMFERIKRISHEQKFWLALVGIVALAVSVNLVELICSAGLPVVFTQILSMSNLATWQYYSYMLVYIIFFMLDDLFVFFTAMMTLRMTGVTTKYTRMTHLIGGLLMVIIGILLIFKPELLMFG